MLCKNLEYFVVFMATLYEHGSQNQPNHNLGTSLVKRICESRKTDNLPALAIQWKATKKTEEIADFAKENTSVVVGNNLSIKSAVLILSYKYL